MDFKGGEYYEAEEILIFLRYEKLFGYCFICVSLCYIEVNCFFVKLEVKMSLEKRREIREGNGGGGGGMKEGSMRIRFGVIKGLLLMGIRVISRRREMVGIIMEKEKVK